MTQTREQRLKAMRDYHKYVYYPKNKERVKKRAIDWYKNNKARAIKRGQEWRKRNIDKVRIYQRMKERSDLEARRKKAEMIQNLKDMEYYKENPWAYKLKMEVYRGRMRGHLKG